MKITKRQLRRLINEALPSHLQKHFRKDGSSVHEPEWEDVTPAGYGPTREEETSNLEDYNPDAVKAAAHAVEKIGRPQGGMIENEIHLYLEEMLGLVGASDEIFNIADEALSVAGIMLGVGPDAL